MITKAEAIQAAKTLSPAMKAALSSIVNQVKSGETEDLSVSGIRLDTLNALEKRGFVRRYNVREVRVSRSRNGFYGKTSVQAVFNVAWNVSRD